MITHEWNGSILTITSDSGTSSADLKGIKGDKGERGARGLVGARGGGALIEDGIISDETTWSSAAIMDNFAEKMYIEGNPIQGYPIPNYPLHIITEIKGDGVENIKLVRCGKNLISTNANSGNSGSITYTNNRDGSFTITGTADKAISVILSDLNVSPIYIGAGATITQSITMVNGSMGNCVVVPAVKNTEGEIKYNYLTNNQTRKADDNYTFNTYTLYIPANEVCDFTFKVQLEVGAIATTYEPYNGTVYNMALGQSVNEGVLDWNKGELVVGETTYQLEPIEIDAIKGANTIFTDAANLRVIGRIDTMYQLALLTERVAALEAAIK